jgi:hypothetical protein
MFTADFPANPLYKEGYTLEFHDEFERSDLDLTKWIPYYLPHWSSREKSMPRYRLDEQGLALHIDADQMPWCPEFDGQVKCSSLQTGLFAGPLDSPIGQHRFNSRCVVREVQTTQRTYTPLYGYFEARVKAVRSSKHLVALWMIGFEEVPTESGEIAIFEVFSDQITAEGSEIRYGVHPWQDPHLTDEFYRDVLPIDATKFHVYAAEWTPSHIDFYVDNTKRRTILQSPNYPMQFMMGIYELPGETFSQETYPQRYVIDYFRAYRPIEGYPSR